MTNDEALSKAKEFFGQVARVSWNPIHGHAYEVGYDMPSMSQSWSGWDWEDAFGKMNKSFGRHENYGLVRDEKKSKVTTPTPPKEPT